MKTEEEEVQLRGIKRTVKNGNSVGVYVEDEAEIADACWIIMTKSKENILKFGSLEENIESMRKHICVATEDGEMETTLCLTIEGLKAIVEIGAQVLAQSGIDVFDE